MKKVIVIMLAVIILYGCNSESTPTAYTVTFDSDGGSPVPAQIVEAGGMAAVFENNPIKDENIFKYWYLKGETVPYDFQTPVTDNITLRAEWLECRSTGCTADALKVYLSLIYYNGQPVILDEAKVFWVNGKRYLENGAGSLYYNQYSDGSLYLIVSDEMFVFDEEMRSGFVTNRPEIMRFTGYLNGKVVCECDIPVRADCCHVYYSGTEPLIQRIPNEDENEVNFSIEDNELKGAVAYKRCSDKGVEDDSINEWLHPKGVAYLFKDSIPKEIYAQYEPIADNWYIVFDSKTDVATIYLDRFHHDNYTMSVRGKICNFPDFAKKWNIPENGCNVVFDGIAYRGTGVSTADHIPIDFVLSKLKRI